MEESKLIERYGHFLKEINRLSEIPLEEEPDLGTIDISRNGMQMVYRDIKAIEFKGGIVDYLCYLSTEMFLRDWLNDCKKMDVGKALLYNLDNPKNVLRLLFKNPKYFFESDYYKEIGKLIEVNQVFQILMDFRLNLYKKSIG